MSRDIARQLLSEWRKLYYGMADEPERHWHREDDAWRRLVNYLDSRSLAGTALDPRCDTYLEGNE